jgi:hypothetical protein
MESQELRTSGKVAAAFISASVAILILGVLTYVRKADPWNKWLVVYEPAAQYSGIFFYSELSWAVIWAGLYFALRNRHVGNTRLWLATFLVALGASAGLVVASLRWLPLPW